MRSLVRRETHLEAVEPASEAAELWLETELDRLNRPMATMWNLVLGRRR